MMPDIGLVKDDQVSKLNILNDRSDVLNIILQAFVLPLYCYSALDSGNDTTSVERKRCRTFMIRFLTIAFLCHKECVFVCGHKHTQCELICMI